MTQTQEPDTLAAENARLTAMLSALPDLMFELDAQGRCLHVHSPRPELLVMPVARQLGRTVEEVLPPAAALACRLALRGALEQGHARGQQYSLDLEDGLHWFELSASRQQLAPGQAPRVIVLSRDITDRRRAEHQQREHESLLRAIVDHTPVQYWARDLEGRCIMENAQVVAHWGSLLGKRLEDSSNASPEDLARWRANNARAYAGEVVDEEIEYQLDGQIRTFQNVVAPVRMDGEIVGIVGFNQDITDRKAAADQIRHLAYYDPLTGLPNRRLMFDRLAQALSQRRAGALLLLDLDHFKELNDTRGHDAGDRLLIEVARRLTSSIRPCDTAARLGGDEFVVIFDEFDPNLPTALQAEQRASELLRRLDEPYLLQLADGGNVSHRFHCSAGIALLGAEDAHPPSAEELLRRTDTALYEAKAAGRNTLRFYDPRLQALVEQRAAMMNDLRAAVEQRQFQLHYQPQVDGQGRIVGAEALLRWLHPQRGMVSPADFIPLAEETGLILPLGQWVLEAACLQLAAWARQPQTRCLTLAVNVSARQFHQPDFVDRLRDCLARNDVPSASLKLELTESLLLDHAEEVICQMQQLKAMGVGFTLDDFGTGYSSLSYLKRLPLDQLKIDRSFVRDVLTDPNDAAIARTIVALANTLGLDVIAEGVETEAQRRFLADNGCSAYQGFLFSRPQPLRQFEALVHAGAAERYTVLPLSSRACSPGE